MPYTGELTYLVLTDHAVPYLLARVHWPDVAQGISARSTDWLEDTGLFDLPYDPSAIAVSFPQAASVAAGWGTQLQPGAAEDVLATARAVHGDEAWVCTRDEMADAGWFGGPLSADAAARLGDVALVAHAPVAFLDPADTGETRLLARHGSLTAAEMLVPLLAVTAR